MHFSDTLRFIVLAALFSAVTACTGLRGAGEAEKLYEINSTYETLGFRGTVTRHSVGTDLEYRVALTLTFLPDAPYNRVDEIHLTSCELSATTRQPPGHSWSLIQRSVQEFAFDLTKDEPTRHLPAFYIRLNRSAVSQADSVGLLVTDGHFGWPIPESLK